MADKPKIGFKDLKNLAKKGIESIDIDVAKGKALMAGEFVGGKAVEIKDSAMAMKDDIKEKLTELDRMLESSITEYNDAYTLMNDKGVQLFLERNRAVDTIAFVENLISSIANRPKTFDAEFEEIDTNRDKFLGCCDFGQRELQAAREAAGGAGAGLAAGASVAFMAPTAAMWIATTFGTASTGAAISTLSGAAATNAALAWLLLTSIVLFASKRAKLNKEKNAEIESVKKNIVIIKKMDAEINQILEDTISIRNGLNSSYTSCLELYGKDYTLFAEDQKKRLGALVNNTKALSAFFGKTVEPVETAEDEITEETGE